MAKLISSAAIMVIAAVTMSLNVDTSNAENEAQLIANNCITNVATGQKTNYQQFWQQGPAVIVFLRRFTCPYCRLDSKRYSQLRPIFDKHNVKFVGIGHERAGLEEFLKGRFFNGEIFIDEDKKTYRDLAFKRFNLFNILPAMLSPSGIQHALDAIKANTGGDMTTGDGLQTGGMLIVGKGGQQVLLSFKQQTPQDHVENPDILKALGLDGEGGQGEDGQQGSEQQSEQPNEEKPCNCG